MQLTVTDCYLSSILKMFRNLIMPRIEYLFYISHDISPHYCKRNDSFPKGKILYDIIDKTILECVQFENSGNSRAIGSMPSPIPGTTSSSPSSSASSVPMTMGIPTSKRFQTFNNTSSSDSDDDTPKINKRIINNHLEQQQQRREFRKNNIDVMTNHHGGGTGIVITTEDLDAIVNVMFASTCPNDDDSHTIELLRYYERLLTAIQDVLCGNISKYSKYCETVNETSTIVNICLKDMREVLRNKFHTATPTATTNRKRKRDENDDNSDSQQYRYDSNKAQRMQNIIHLLKYTRLMKWW